MGKSKKNNKSKKPKMVHCKGCGGKGFDDGIKCAECNGKGKSEVKKGKK